MGKKPVDIEKLLQWAYCDELPKEDLALPSWDRIEDYGDLGGVSVSWSTTPQRYAYISQPHPDALLLDYMVRSLPAVRVNWTRDGKLLLGPLLPWLRDQLPLVATMMTDPIPVVETRSVRRRADSSARVVDCVEQRQRSTSAAAAVVMHARLRSRPVWDLGLRVVPLRGRNGKPVIEHEGEGLGKITRGLTKGRRYGPMARCLLTLDPSAAEIACARWEYFVWHQALETLANESWKLADHVALPPAAAALPWRIDTEERADVLADLTAPAVPQMPAAPKKYAGARRPRTQHGPVIHLPFTTIKEPSC